MDHAPPDIEDVRRPFPKIRILHLLHALGVGADDVLIDAFHAHFPHFQLAANRPGDGAVRRHHQMRLKDVGLLLAKGMGELLADFLDLFPGLEQRRLQAPHFILNLLFPDRGGMDPDFLLPAENRQSSADHARGGGDPRESEFRTSRGTGGFAHGTKFSPPGLLLVELSFHQLQEGLDRLRGPGPRGDNADPRAHPGSQHHQPHDALSVDRFPVFLHVNLTFVPVGLPDKHRRRAGMQPQPVFDHGLLPVFASLARSHGQRSFRLSRVSSFSLNSIAENWPIVFIF